MGVIWIWAGECDWRHANSVVYGGHPTALACDKETVIVSRPASLEKTSAFVEAVMVNAWISEEMGTASSDMVRGNVSIDKEMATFVTFGELEIETRPNCKNGVFYGVCDDGGHCPDHAASDV